MSEHGNHELSHQYETMDQQYEASTLGLWTFLVTEVLFFGGMFLLYTIYRYRFPTTFAECGHYMNLTLGIINTVVLTTSSLTMAFAVSAAEEDDRKTAIRWILVTMVLGAIFLGIKMDEYHTKFVEHLVPGPFFLPTEVSDVRPAEIFFSLYFSLTGLHAIHMIVGLGVLGTMAVLIHKGKFSKTYSTPVHIAGLYWHFVEVVWIFLFPMIYLIGPR